MTKFHKLIADRYQVIARNVPIPEARFKEISEWAIKMALSFLFAEKKASPKLYKKYDVPKIKSVKPNETRIETYILKKSDFKIGTAKQDAILLHIGVVNKPARSKGYYAVFIPKHPAIGLYQPWDVHELDDFAVREYVKDLKESMRHEFVHFVQWATEEGVGGKFDENENYWLRSHEYKPQLESAVRRLEKDLTILDELKHKPTRKHLEQFVALKPHTPKYGTMLGDIVSDPFFLELKKKDRKLWQIAIKDFIQLLTKSPSFKYKALLGLN